ncbi:MAG: pyridoxamine kinase [Succiniclasticum sp.]|jgi:pyridoxine kinase
MNHTKRVLAIHDLCSFGRCSLTAAVPVLSAMGFQCCPFPTALFSNNLTYGDFANVDCTPTMTKFMDKWQQLGLGFDAVYSGFLANAGQISVVRDAVHRFAGKEGLVVVDPAMADDGKLYAVFGPDIVPEMRKLVGDATVATPNYTEACLLTDTAYTPAAGRDVVTSLCRKVAALGPKQVVITSVPSADADKITTAAYDAASDSYTETVVDRIPFATCGTGDLFTSVLTGSLLRGASVTDSVQTAAGFLTKTIDYTYHAGSDYREGVQFERFLGLLAPQGQH